MNAALALSKAPDPSRALTASALSLHAVEQRMRSAHASHLGYPYNLVCKPAEPAGFGNYLINNLGDPYAGSHYGSEVCDLEREAIAWLMDLWDCADHKAFWGSIGASGTEGNLWALYLGREALERPVLLYSADAHYSIPKSARILRIEERRVASHADGSINLASLRNTLPLLGGRPVILALTCGTTVKGAHDDIGGALAVLDQAGYGPERRYVHIDGALNAMVLPFLDGVPLALQPSFRHAIDSISTSGHKMIGTPMPCGALVARRRHVERVSSAVAYLRSNDTTLMGSRNGHAVLAVWLRFMEHGQQGFRADTRISTARAASLAVTLRGAGVPVLLNSFSLTLVFPKPAEDLVNTYQLACNGGEAHAIIMPSVTDQLINRFADDYLAWWQASGQRAGQQREHRP